MLQERPSALERKHPVLQKMKSFTFSLFMWAIFALLDPDLDTDPSTPLNPDPIRIRIHNMWEKSTYNNIFIFTATGR
jgi:hypothetical protein